MRKVINKGIDEAAVLSAAETLVAGGIPNLKLYFMVGLPTEEMTDVDAIIALCKRIQHRFLKSSRTRGRIGDITVSLNSFVPKPMTPFQWTAMDEIGVLKQKIRRALEGAVGLDLSDQTALERYLNRLPFTVHATAPASR